jgi:shikimate dehydrogenase
MDDDATPTESEQPTRRLAVLGSPIAHSKSPSLHLAAYEALGLDWDYESIDVTSETLEKFISTRGSEWRGLSLTMPLKQTVLPLLASLDAVATLTGSADTVLFDDSGSQDSEQAATLRGFNTDVAGIVRALSAVGLTSARYVHVLGGGATAASALAAAADLGAERVLVSVRSIERASWLEGLGESLGLVVQLRPLAIADRTLEIPELVISTLPGGVPLDVLFTDSTRRRSVLLDVAYDPWPSVLATEWSAVGGTVVSGLEMLLYQALLQVRVFVSGDPLEELDDEETVLAAMRASVGLDVLSAVPES